MICSLEGHAPIYLSYIDLRFWKCHKKWNIDHPCIATVSCCCLTPQRPAELQRSFMSFQAQGYTSSSFFLRLPPRFFFVGAPSPHSSLSSSFAALPPPPAVAAS